MLNRSLQLSSNGTTRSHRHPHALRPFIREVGGPTRRLRFPAIVALGFICLAGNLTCAQGIEDIQKRGVLRHLGGIYAGFVTPTGKGFDAELIQGFARSLGVRYEFVLGKDPATLISDLTGTAPATGTNATSLPADRTGRLADLAASGITISEERKKHLLFSQPTLPTQVWALTKADTPVQPITPGKSTQDDVRATKALLSSMTVLGKANTLLDPRQYGIELVGSVPNLFEGSIAELVPALLIGEGDAALLDLPAASQALRRWSGRIKVLGPVADWQYMGVAFAKDAPDLVRAFDLYLEMCRSDGTILRLVHKYFPALVKIRPEFFGTCNSCDGLGAPIPPRRPTANGWD